MKHVLFWNINVFIPKLWIKLEIFLSGCLVKLISLRRLVMPLRCLSLIQVLFMLNHRGLICGILCPFHLIP